MPLDANIYGDIGQPVQSVNRLAQIFDPTVIQARQLQQAQTEQEQGRIARASKLQQLLGGMQTQDPAAISGQLAKGGFADEAMKYQGLADAQRQRQEAEVSRRADTTRKAFGQIAAMGGDSNAVRKTLSQLPWMNPQQIEEAAAAADMIPPEGRQSHFLGLADPQYLAKRQEAEAARIDKGEQAAAQRVAAAELEKQRAADRAQAREENNAFRRDITREQIAGRAENAKLMSNQNAILGGSKQFEAENKLRDEFQKGSSNFVKLRDAYGLVQAAAKDPSAAGDLSLIFAYMRTLDPNSVVREGEFATAQNAASVPDRVRNAYNKALSGERLNPEQRKDFVNNAEKIYTQQKVGQDKLTGEYKKLANAYGLKEGNIVTDYDTAPSAPTAKAGRPPLSSFNKP